MTASHFLRNLQCDMVGCEDVNMLLVKLQVIRQEDNRGRLPNVSVTPWWANCEIFLTYDLEMQSLKTFKWFDWFF